MNRLAEMIETEQVGYRPGSGAAWKDRSRRYSLLAIGRRRIFKFKLRVAHLYVAKVQNSFLSVSGAVEVSFSWSRFFLEALNIISMGI
jgi:hypothetical protein